MKFEPDAEIEQKGVFFKGLIIFPGMMNRIFVGTIRGLGPFFSAGTYNRVDIRPPSTDPVLSRAAEIGGGFPQAQIVAVNGKIPETMHYYLEEKGIE